MAKRLQNAISESKLTFPVSVVFAIGIWMLCGAFRQGWWIQMGCFALSVGLITDLANRFSLLRSNTHMVGVVYLFFSCCACLQFSSVGGELLSACVPLSYLFLFLCQEGKYVTGLVYYAFLAFGVASIGVVHILYFLPLIWLFMRTNLSQLTWRTWMVSMMGLLTPYWFAFCWYFIHKDLSPFVDHFRVLGVFQSINYDVIPAHSQFTIALILALMVICLVHYMRKNRYDSFRIRLLFEIFIWMDLAAVVFLFLQPQHYDLLLRLLFINVAPLVAHFIVLTSTKATNVMFILITFVILVLTAYNILWTQSLLF